MAMEPHRLHTLLRNNQERAYRYIISALYQPTDGPPQDDVQTMLATLYADFLAPVTSEKEGETSVRTKVFTTIMGVHRAAAEALLDRVYGKASQPITGEDGGPIEVIDYASTRTEIERKIAAAIVAARRASSAERVDG